MRTFWHGKIPVRGAVSVFGTFLMNLMFGAFYSFGNLMPYIVSYMREEAGLDITYSDFGKVQQIFSIFNGMALFFTPALVAFTSNKFILVVGSLLFSAGPLITRFTMEESLGLVILSMSVIQGLGNIALLPTFTISVGWFPENRGTAIGCTLAGYGISSLLMTPFQMAIANPNNVPATAVNGSDDKYYTDPDVIDRIPTLMYSLSALYFSFLMLGCLFISDPPKAAKEEPKEKLKYKWANVKEEIKTFARVVLTRWEFYLLMVTRIGINMVTFIVPTYYKAFALTFIESDQFISRYIGSLSGVFQFFSRTLYGVAFDWFPYRAVVGLLSATLAAVTATLYLTIDLGKYAFMAWMWLIYLNFPAIYGILVAKSTEVFGGKYGGQTYGTLGLSDIPLNFIIAVMGDSILQGDQIDYFYMFIIAACGPAAVFLVTMFFPATEEDSIRRKRLRRKIKCANTDDDQ